MNTFPKQVLAVAFTLWVSGVRVSSAPQVAPDPVEHAEPVITGEPVKPPRVRVYASERQVWDMLSRMLGLPSPQMEP